MIRTNSFCGNEYTRHGAVQVGDGRECNMTLELEPDVQAGGRWAMSIYELAPNKAHAVAASSGEEGEVMGTGSSHQEGTDAGGATDVGTSGELGPVATGERAFTVVNECSQTIRVGSTGGR